MIYLDHNATTPVSERVIEAMRPWWSDAFFNPSSSHAGGHVAAVAVDEARMTISEQLGASSATIVLTSGATESNNLALCGVAEAKGVEKTKIVTFAAEHKAILDVARYLMTRGAEVVVLPVLPGGEPDLVALQGELRQGGATLVSAMWINNEIGTIADIAAVATICHEHDALVHTDATQAVGRLNVDFDEVGVDLLSFSGHKIYGPKGTGALLIRRGVDVAAQVHGGGHQNGYRSGTFNVPGAVGLAEACRESGELLDAEAPRQSALVDYLCEAIEAGLDDVSSVIPDSQSRACNTVNLRFSGVDAEAVMVNMPDIAVSTGSACTALVPQPSHVLLAIGLTSDDANSCLRFSVGRSTTKAEIDVVVDRVIAAVNRVRSLTA